MAYFSNGSEGSAYQARYCARCVHDVKKDCPIWALHLSYNYEQFDTGPRDTKATVRNFLSALIPETPDGLSQAQCRLFHPTFEPSGSSTTTR